MLISNDGHGGEYSGQQRVGMAVGRRDNECLLGCLPGMYMLPILPNPHTAQSLH